MHQRFLNAPNATPRYSRAALAQAAQVASLIDPEFIQRTMSERDFQGQVISMAEALGWLVYHTYDSRHSKAGFPDLNMVRWMKEGE